MTVTLDLGTELERQIISLAAAQGLTPEAYLVSFIETLVLPAAAEEATLDQFEAAMDELAAGMNDVPMLSPEAISRGSI